MASLNEYRQEQLQKIAQLRELGVDPYPSVSDRTHSVADVTSDAEAKMGEQVVVSGRLLSQREHGQVQFVDIIDESHTIQLILRGEMTADYNSNKLGFGDLNLLTRGDIIEAGGVVSKSETGELSVECEWVRVLAKVARPLPEKLEDKETRLRRPYLDMAVNPEVRERFERRSKFWQATRDFMNNEGFVEVNTPVLEHTTGGADANPFVTHMDALHEDFYLRISHELPLKRLLGAGFNKVYDIGPRFRNENYSDEHLPEHVAFESYSAFDDYEDGMKLYERMMKHIAMETWGTLQFTVGEFEVNLDQQWPKRSYADILKEEFDVDVFAPNLDQLKAILKDNQVEFDDDINANRALDAVWKIVRRRSPGPFWLIHEPVAISPLAKSSPEDARVSQRFHPVIAGTEMGNGYTELNDPADQLARFLEQQQMRDSGDDEAQMLDVDFVEMLEYGMPPACGWGHSERFFWAMEGVTAREGVPFPHLRREVSEVTKEIYPEVYGPDGIVAQASSKDQDFSKRIVAVVNKELEPWQVANTASHMSAYHAHKMAKDEFDTGEVFVTKDSHQLPRNSQYPIIIKRADMKELRKLYKKSKELNVAMHMFVKEMIETTNDQEITEALKEQSIDEVQIYGVALFGDNDEINGLTKHFQLWN